MVKLTDRLMLMAEQIKENETMADIGTDHGFLPMYLADEGICPQVILVDVSQGSLNKARNNVEALIEKRAAEGRQIDPDVFDFRLGDGIKVLVPGEADAIVIAGMGGILISEILDGNKETARAAKRIIMQPRNGSGRLRYYLLQNGFDIESDLLVREGKFICEVIVASYGKESTDRYKNNESTESAGIDLKYSSRIDDSFGGISYALPKTLLENGEIALEYINRKLNKYRNILAEMEAAVVSGDRADEIRISKEKIKSSMLYCEKLLKDGDIYDNNK